MSDIAYLAQQIRALIRAMGMQAENQIREHRGEALAYDENAFIELLNQYGG
jgi:hypothetical protein